MSIISQKSIVKEYNEKNTMIGRRACLAVARKSRFAQIANLTGSEALRFVAGKAGRALDGLHRFLLDVRPGESCFVLGSGLGGDLGSEMLEEDYYAAMRGGKSFEFQGYVVSKDGSRGPARVFRRNLQEIGIDIDTRAMIEGCGIVLPGRTLEEMDEYEIYFRVSAEYQRIHRIVAHGNRLDTENEFRCKFLEDYRCENETDAQVIERIRVMEEGVVLKIDKITSRETHEAVRILHNFMADLISAGANLISVFRMAVGYQISLCHGNGGRVIFLQPLQADPKWEQLKPLIRRYFPGIDLEAPLPRLPGHMAGLLGGG